MINRVWEWGSSFTILKYISFTQFHISIHNSISILMDCQKIPMDQNMMQNYEDCFVTKVVVTLNECDDGLDEQNEPDANLSYNEQMYLIISSVLQEVSAANLRNLIYSRLKRSYL
jgi:hypothetical protein